MPLLGRGALAYETENVDALRHPAYLARLDDPSPWTRRVVPHFRRTSRTICEVVASVGCGQGGFVATDRGVQAVAASALSI